MPPIDDALLEEALAARERCSELELQLAQRKADFGRAVRRLHASGASLREIAGALELSHQRVHQLVGPARAGGWMTLLRLGRHPGGSRAAASCSFCGVGQVDTARLVAGPGVYICDGCIGAATRAATRASTEGGEEAGFTQVPAAELDVRCGFCGRGHRRTNLILKGGRQGRTICDSCLRLCNEILAESPAP